jgi:hypothetical protein
VQDILAKARQEYCRWRQAQCIQAWLRRLPELPFPIKVEGESVYVRRWKGEWEEQGGFHAELILAELPQESSAPDESGSKKT